jgi:hypothetical protein
LTGCISRKIADAAGHRSVIEPDSNSLRPTGHAGHNRPPQTEWSFSGRSKPNLCGRDRNALPQ